MKDPANDKDERTIEAILIVLSLAALAFVQCSCRTQRVAGEITTRDSVRIVYRMDSVYRYEHDSIYIRERADTVFVDRWHTRYRDALRVVHDTAYVDRVRETTIQVPYITKAQRNMIAGFWTLLALLIIAVALLAWKNWGKVRTWWMKLIAKILLK